jgi:hypothetical protein
VAGRDGVAVEGAGHERGELAVQDGDHRLVEQPQPVDHMARPDQRATLAVEANGHQVGLTEPTAELLHPACCIHRGRRLPGLQARLHPGQMQQQPVHRALRDPLQQVSGAADPPHSLRLVPPRQVEDAQHQGGPCGLHRSGAGQERVACCGAEPQVIVDAAEPPHGIGIVGEVVRGELLGRDGVEARRGGSPVARRVGLPRLGQADCVLVHPLSLSTVNRLPAASPILSSSRLSRARSRAS